MVVRDPGNLIIEGEAKVKVPVKLTGESRKGWAFGERNAAEHKLPFGPLCVCISEDVY